MEYGIMQELVRGTGRRMWFLHDPVEDNPEYTWEDFRKNYLKTVIASLLHPGVHHYEVSPWPHRVFDGIYPKSLIITGGMTGGEQMEGAKPIPEEYARLLCSIVQTLGDMEQPDAYFVGDAPKIGIFMADSGLYQRTFPDNVPHSPGGVAGMNDALLRLKYRELAGEDVTDDSAALMQQIGEDAGLYNDYVTSGPFPQFFGLAMPLLKGGIPLRPVQLENLDRYEDYVKQYDTLILSYEFMKPRKPEYHEILAEWVKQGGRLIYVGDGSDPYHRAKDWWNTGERTYLDPAEHLFERMGVPMLEGIHTVGAGSVAYYAVSPGRITLTEEAARRWQNFARDVSAPDFAWTNRLDMQRGPYRIISVMDEGMTGDAHTVRGHYVDMLDPDYPIVQEKIIHPGENALLFDLDTIRQEPVRIIGTSARIFSLEETGEGYNLICKAADRIRVTMRLKLKKPVFTASAVDETGMQLKVDSKWDEESSSLILSFPSTNRLTTILLT